MGLRNNFVKRIRLSFGPKRTQNEITVEKNNFCDCVKKKKRTIDRKYDTATIKTKLQSRALM